MKNFFKKFNFNKRQILLVIFFIAFSFIFAQPANAFVLRWVTSLLGGILIGIAYLLGLFLMMIIRVVIYLAQYNNFIHSPIVTNGWVMVRDLSNMFFIVLLLIIAFATILNIPKYNYKKWLPKLVLMAILINFSKIICGLMIDVAQIIMLSFVNSFKNMGGTNITVMMGMQDWKTYRKKDDTGDGVSEWELLATYFFAVIYVIVTIVVMIAFIGVLMMRIVMIWIYVVLSPLAFILGAFPDGASHAQKWWTQFSQNLIAGPVLAFFLWLSFSSVSATNPENLLGKDGDPPEHMIESGEETDGIDNPYDSREPVQLMVNFIVSIALLIGGLKVTQEVGGAAGGAAGKGMNRLNKMKANVGGGMSKMRRGAGKFAKKKAAVVGRAAARGSLGVVSKVSPKSKVGQMAGALRQDMIITNQKRKMDNREKFLKAIGGGEQLGDVIANRSGKPIKQNDYMRRAAAKMSSKPKNAREMMDSVGGKTNEFNVDDLKGQFGNKKGANSAQQDANLNMLANPDKFMDKDGSHQNAIQGRDNLESWLKNAGKEGGFDQKNADHVKLANELKNGIDKAEKSGDIDVSNLGGIKSALSKLSEAQLSGEYVEKKTGKEALADAHKTKTDENDKKGLNTNQNKLFVNSFANNKKGESGKEVIGIDFKNLKGIPNTNPKANSIDLKKGDENSGEVVKVILSQIETAKNNLEANRENLSEENYNKELNDLNAAEDKLKSNNFEEIKLLNLDKPEFRTNDERVSEHASALKEIGLDDEKLVNKIAELAVALDKHGRIDTSQLQHIGKEANSMKNNGSSDSEISSNIENNIREILNSESKKSAETVFKKESGEDNIDTKKINEEITLKIADLKKDKESSDSSNEKIKLADEGIKALNNLSESLKQIDKMSAEKDNISSEIKKIELEIKDAQKKNNSKIVIDNQMKLKPLQNQLNTVAFNLRKQVQNVQQAMINEIGKESPVAQEVLKEDDKNK